MISARWLVLILVVAVPLTACLAFAAGDLFVAHPWNKHSQTAAHAAVKLPSGIGTATTVLVAPALLGPLAASSSPVAASIALRPPFVPPRA